MNRLPVLDILNVDLRESLELERGIELLSQESGPLLRLLLVDRHELQPVRLETRHLIESFVKPVVLKAVLKQVDNPLVGSLQKLDLAVIQRKHQWV